MLHSGKQPDGKRKIQVTSTVQVAGAVSKEISLILMILYYLTFCF